MSSNIEVIRICQNCGKEFFARTTKTRNCSDKCAKEAYKKRKRSEKIAESNSETYKFRNRSIIEIQAKDYISVSEAAEILGFSKRTVYRLIEQGILKASNISVRLTRISRTDIDVLMGNDDNSQSLPISIELKEHYNIGEIVAKYGVSRKTIEKLIMKNDIRKIPKGRCTYVSKKGIDKIFAKRKI